MKYKVFTRDYNLNCLEQVLYNRGFINKEQMSTFVYPNNKSIQSEYGLDNIEEAAKELCRNLAHQNKIHIVVDSDCDGYTSASLLLNYLHRIFPATVENNVTYSLHPNKHHGIVLEDIPEGVKLIITPDSSSNESDIHLHLQEHGIHTIVLDHHQADKNDTDPAIIVNNQMSDYLNKDLSGVGIVYKFCKVLDKIFHVSYADNYLDLVSLGNCADMMDLHSPETHYYIVEGTKNIQNIFYNKLIEKQSFSMKGEVNPFTIGWYIAPLINAITRSGTLEEKTLIFEAFLDYEAVKMIPSTKRGHRKEQELKVEQAVRVAANVKARQEKIKKEVFDSVLPQLEEQKDKPIIVVKFDPPINENLNGLLANQIMGIYHKPTFVLNKNDDNWSGSARGFASNQITDWRSFVENSGYAEYAQGHSFAFGCSFTNEGLNFFNQKILEIFGTAPIETYYDIDLSYLSSDSFDKEISQLGGLQGLWGQSVQEPLIAIEKICLTQDDICLLGKGTLKLLIEGHETTIIKFNSEDIYNDLISHFSSQDSRIYITIIGTCSINDFNGRQTPQIKLKDYEITNVQDWYF